MATTTPSGRRKNLWNRLVDAIQVPQEQFVSKGRQWSNHDLDPTPPEERKWTAWVYASFWAAHAANASAWTAGSATVALGLTWWDAWIAINVSHIIGTFMVVANGRVASRYHIGFPVAARASWGMWGSYMAVIMRAVVCIIWNGVNTFYAGRLVDVCLQCIWPSWTNIANTLPETSGITTRHLITFLIAWFLFQCLTLFHPRDLKWFYIVKSIIVFVAMHGILGWWIHRNGGVSFPSQTATKLSPSTRGWLWMQAFNSGFGTISSLTVNQADIARYSRKPSDQFWGQVLMFPVASAIPGLYGILVASASKELYGKALWNLWDVTQAMLDQYPNNSGARFGVFLAAGSMALALIAVNLSTNCLPFGSDVTALFPKYMTIKRGQFICCLAGLAIVPWKILKDGKTFLAFLSGYGYWLAPGASILCVDYFFVHKGNIVVKELYNGKPTALYWYKGGWNIRAPIVTVLALIPCMPGFAYSIAPRRVHISDDAKHMSYVSFLLTYVIACILYYVSYKIWPSGSPVKEVLEGKRFEVLADELDEDEREQRHLGSQLRRDTSKEF
ncbi:allantoin transport [Moniliophthora roreri MCA 2997]|uniref:Allantoin transport n=1 Tax=Moniliophthora roreri (strain MCA 2997) TaxID=1381753 RepID=V2XR29_MONRO|nr:allantoin transport [Moniliophthora roreri MCA 2997]